MSPTLQGPVRSQSRLYPAVAEDRPRMKIKEGNARRHAKQADRGSRVPGSRPAPPDRAYLQGSGYRIPTESPATSQTGFRGPFSGRPKQPIYVFFGCGKQRSCRIPGPKVSQNRSHLGDLRKPAKSVCQIWDL